MTRGILPELTRGHLLLDHALAANCLLDVRGPSVHATCMGQAGMVKLESIVVLHVGMALLVLGLITDGLQPECSHPYQAQGPLSHRLQGALIVLLAPGFTHALVWIALARLVGMGIATITAV